MSRGADIPNLILEPPTADVPSIQVTAQDSTHDLESYPDRPLTPESPFATANSHSHSSHTRSPSDPSFLLPNPTPILKSPSTGTGNTGSLGRASLDVPHISGSPTVSGYDTDGSSMQYPPSPTLSTRSSVQFTTLALRDNKPEESNGLSSLGLLAAPASHSHSRRSSNASTIGYGRASTEETDPDSHSIALQPMSPGTSSCPSPTTTQCETASFAGTTIRERSPSRRPKPDFTGSLQRKDTGDSEDSEEIHIEQIDLEADKEIDAGAFKVKPNQLASLVDPKNFPVLREIGGLKGVLRGLGTNGKTGLSGKALIHVEENELDEKIVQGKDKGSTDDGRPGGGGTAGAGDGASQRHDRPPSPPMIVVTSPGGEPDGKPSEQAIQEGDDDREQGEDDPKNSATYDANLEERRRVFGENVLPTRKTKSLLQLMWLALKDKVLVSRCHILCARFDVLTLSVIFRSCFPSPLLYLWR